MVDVVNNTEKIELWHCRLGHMSEKGMKLLLNDGKIPKLKSVDHHLCKSCVFGKQERVSFLIGGRELKHDRLELVHTNVYKPATVSSFRGSYYYITFIDDSTKKLWVYYMQNKSKVYNVFKKYKSHGGE